MIIISSRKFRDSQNEYLQKALSEEVILTTLKFGNFRLVPIIEGEDVDEESIIRKRASRKTNRKPLQGESKEKLKEESGVQSMEKTTIISENAVEKETRISQTIETIQENNEENLMVVPSTVQTGFPMLI